MLKPLVHMLALASDSSVLDTRLPCHCLAGHVQQNLRVFLLSGVRSDIGETPFLSLDELHRLGLLIFASMVVFRFLERLQLIVPTVISVLGNCMVLIYRNAAFLVYQLFDCADLR